MRKQKGKINLPKKTGFIAVWYDPKGKQHLIQNSIRKTKKSALRIADEYMLINQVKTSVVECIY